MSDDGIFTVPTAPSGTWVSLTPNECAWNEFIRVPSRSGDPKRTQDRGSHAMASKHWQRRPTSLTESRPSCKWIPSQSGAYPFLDSKRVAPSADRSAQDREFLNVFSACDRI
jgi:hypothetical protein